VGHAAARVYVFELSALGRPQLDRKLRCRANGDRGHLVPGQRYVSSLLHVGAAPDDPWDAGSLEWATSSPPPEHNFEWLPPIRSFRPAFDLHHPELFEQTEAKERLAIAKAKQGKFF
jgi:hypothetical protein